MEKKPSGFHKGIQTSCENRKGRKKSPSDQLKAAESWEMTLCGSHGLRYVTLCVILSSESLAFDLKQKT